MPAFDPTAATAAWLSRLPQSERLAAQAHTDFRLFAWFAGGALMIGLCGLVARADLLGRVRRRVEGGRPRPWLAGAVAAGALAFVVAAAKAVFDAWAGWRGAAILGRPENFTDHLRQTASGVFPVVAAAMILAPMLMWLMRKRPGSWPLIAGEALITLMLAIGWLPYALSAGPDLTPAPPSVAEAGIAHLIAETHLPAHGVYLRPDPDFDADVTGDFGHATVSVGPMLLAGPASEARAYVGHLMGHYAHRDILVACLIVSGVLVLGLFALQRWTAPLARLIGGRPVLGQDEPEALPAAAIILILAITGAGLAGGAYLRWANVGADAYSLDHAREPDGLAAVIEREWLGDPGRDGVTPSWLETAIFYTHPPMTTRLAYAMAWKAAQSGR